jgi:xylan 1,4-beta-xylosidase
LILLFSMPWTALAQDSFPVHIRVDAGQSRGELREIWRFFGADEPNYATMPHGQKLIGHLGELRPKQVYFRTHNLLTTGDGTPALKWGSTNVYTEDALGTPVYDWKILDQIFDGYLERGVRPYAQIGFMPKALSTKPEPYQHRWRVGARYEEIYTGWAYPPKDYDKWGELVFQWVKHCVERYGAEEVKTWYWETWNEANIPHWQGTPEEFYKLHDYAIAAVRRALPEAKVGGPDVAGSGGRFMRDFLNHCLTGTNHATGKTGTPMDFVSFHAKGSPRTVDGHVRMGLSNQLRTIDEGFRMIAGYPTLKDKPIVIGESDPEGCAACQGPQLAYRNGTMYSSYTAASFARKMDLADRHGVNLEGALTWAFEFEGHPYFAGFRSLATNGIDKPVLNVFRMYGKMSGQRLTVTSDKAVPLDQILQRGVRGQPDVSALASRDDRTVCIMVWHYHDDDVPGPIAKVTLSLAGLPETEKPATLTHYRIDEKHSNAFTLWKEMGSPQSPTREQYAELETRGKLQQLSEPRDLPIHNRQAQIAFDLPRRGVSLVVVELPK